MHIRGKGRKKKEKQKRRKGRNFNTPAPKRKRRREGHLSSLKRNSKGRELTHLGEREKANGYPVHGKGEC